MTGLIIEFTLVCLLFVWLWRRQVAERRRAQERAAQLAFDFEHERDSRG